MARASYSGRVQAGLVTFGIKAYATFRSTGEDTRLHKLHGACGSRVKQRWHCSVEEHGLLNPDDLIRGYEYEKDQYIQITDDDLARIEPSTDEGRVFVLEQTCGADHIDALWIDNSYYVMPSENTDRQAYALFSRALRDEKLVGVVTFISHHKHHLAILQPETDGMMMHTLRFADTLVRLEDVGKVDKVSNLRTNEITMARKLLSSFNERFRWDTFRDNYRDKLQSLVEAKVHERPLPQTKTNGKPVADLMDAIRQSLDRIEKKKKNGKNGKKGRK